MEQLSLFSEQNIHKNTYTANLRKFRLDKALNDLQILKRTFNPPSSLNEKMQALQQLIDVLPEKKEAQILFLANLREDASLPAFLQPLAEDFHFLRQGIDKRLYDLLDKTEYEFIVEGVHPAEIFISQNDFQNALQVVEKYFATYGEHAYLRQLHGFALWQSGEKNRAYYDFTFALFDGPAQCRLTFLAPKTYRNKFSYLVTKLGNAEKALLRLPFALWLDGQTYIDAENEQFEQRMRQKSEGYAQIPTSSDEILERFNTLLYLAEVLRLRAAPRHPGREFETLQEKMQALHLEYFRQYYETLKRFRNIA